MQPSGGPYGGATKHRWGGAKARPSELPYETMSVEEIADLPVSDLADQNAHLYLWITNYHLRSAWDMCSAWGFRASQVLVWAKPPRGIGLGGAYTQTAEFVIFARRGTLPALKRVDTSWFNWKRPHNTHSAKPEAFLDLVEQVSPGPYLEMFARRQRLGWDTWGNEALNHVEIG